MRRLVACLALAPLSLLAGPAFPQSADALPPISTLTFAAGSKLSTASGELAPGGRNLYYVAAKAGQTMLVSITSPEDIAFQIYRPDTTIAKADDGAPLVQGKTLPNAGPRDAAKAWVGAIPHDGKYLITVGATAAGGPPAPTSYSLTVSLQ